MADSIVWDWSQTAASNSTVGGGVNIAEACPMSTLNDGERAIMAGVKGSLIVNTASGGDTYAANLSPALGTYTTGSQFFLNFANANTGSAPTININSLGATTMTQRDGATALLPADINGVHSLEFDGSVFRLMNPANRRSMILFSTIGQSLTTSTQYYLAESAYTIEGQAQIPVPFSGVLRNLRVQGGASSSGTVVATVRHNSTNTPITCSFSGSTSSGADLSHTASVIAGDIINLSFLTNATSATTFWRATLEYDAP